MTILRRSPPLAKDLEKRIEKSGQAEALREFVAAFEEKSEQTKISTEEKENYTLQIHFPSQQAADAFLAWFGTDGEQDYWEAMDYRGMNNCCVFEPIAGKTMEWEAVLYDEYFGDNEENDEEEEYDVE